ncbi:hypothetical protein BV898_05141 [Hypsibius exemplaris]|uniref:EF-hand domain-containing protein n=1 Tax=Hypsibius exemplaris TaxID=2072580 RepID=A0A1W0X042_HYPEX|nr:hypothetical protein BV898_05141 [Hypsibius exemplaris]
MNSAASKPRDASHVIRHIVVDPTNEYIAWTVPEVLFPLINARKQQTVLPVLHFTLPNTAEANTAKMHQDLPLHRVRKSTALPPVCAPKPEELTVDREPLGFLLGNLVPAKVKTPASHEKPCRIEPTFQELWRNYRAALRLIQSNDRIENHAERFFDWLDEKTKHGLLERKVYEKLKVELELRLRNSLKWARRKLTVREYRVPLETVEEFPEETPPVVRAIEESTSDVRKILVYEKVMVLAESRFSRFPALINTKHSERTKQALKKLAGDIHKKRHIEVAFVGKRSPAGIKARGKPSSDNSDSGSGKTRKVSGKKSKKTKKKEADQKQSQEEIDSEEDSEISEDGEDAGSDEDDGTGAHKKRKKNKLKKKGYVSIRANKNIDWTVRPVEAKLGMFEYYTKTEIEQLQQHARKTYNFKLEMPEPLTIEAPDPTVGEGPHLVAPVLVQLMAEAVYNKRWRLMDLFKFADKDKTWRLDPIKIRQMCYALDLDFTQVSDVAIADLFVELDDTSRKQIQYRDLCRGMDNLVKEKRIRKRYCIAVDESSLLQPMGSASPKESGAVKIPPSGMVDKKANLLTRSGSTPARKFVESENKQPIPPPLQLGTDVCDEVGDACLWHTVFPEELILAWRIQQKLARLYNDSRWLEVKNTVRMYGQRRTVSHTTLNRVLPNDDSPPPTTATVVRTNQLAGTGPGPSQVQLNGLQTNATLEDLENYGRPPDIQSHEEMHKRLSVVEIGAKPLVSDALPMITATTAIKRAGSQTDRSLSSREDFFTGNANYDSHKSRGMRKINKKRSVMVLEERDDHTELDRFLRCRFRAAHNRVPIDLNPVVLLEVPQIRTKKCLEGTAKEEEDRLQAALDPARQTEPTRGLMKEVMAVLTAAHREVQSSVSKSTLSLSFQEMCANDAKRRAEIKKRLLLETNGLIPSVSSTMDSKTKALLFQVKRLKSALHLHPPDIRSCSRTSMSFGGSTTSLASMSNQTKGIVWQQHKLTEFGNAFETNLEPSFLGHYSSHYLKCCLLQRLSM